jgi:hypothetical protein
MNFAYRVADESEASEEINVAQGVTLITLYGFGHVLPELKAYYARAVARPAWQRT